MALRARRYMPNRSTTWLRSHDRKLVRIVPKQCAKFARRDHGSCFANYPLPTPIGGRLGQTARSRSSKSKRLDAILVMSRIHRKIGLSWICQRDANLTVDCGRQNPSAEADSLFQLNAFVRPEIHFIQAPLQSLD